MTNQITTSTPTRTRRERESQKRRETILEAARQIFFDKGIQVATVEDVAAQAEIAKGTVYLYFSSKEELIAQLLLQGLDLLLESLDAAFDEGVKRTASERLRRLAEAYLEFAGERPNYFRLIMAYDRGQFQESISGELYQRIFDRSKEGLQWIMRAIEQGMQDGEFSSGNARERAGMAWAALNGVLVLFGHSLRRALLETDIEAIYAGVLDMILRDLHTAPPT